MIKIGPAGIGGTNEAIKNLELFHQHNLKAAEIAFTYGIYLKQKDTEKIGEAARQLKIDLSIHAPYYINLNSKEKYKVDQSKKRILSCVKIGDYLGAKYIVFHPGFYGKFTPEETYEKIKEEILDMQDIIHKNDWKPKLAPETTGKINVFGDLDQTLKLAKETKTAFTIDFAHLKARNLGKLDLKETIKRLKPYKHVHCHFSGINYTEKGEKNHIPINPTETKELLKELKKQNINCTLICEAPDPFHDAIKMQKILSKLS